MVAEFRLTPVGSRTPFARLLAELLPILADSSLQYQVHAMGTTLEGELTEMLDVVRRCHEEARKHADRVLLELSVDDRAGAEGELVRSLNHLRECTSKPLERLVHDRAS